MMHAANLWAVAAELLQWQAERCRGCLVAAVEDFYDGWSVNSAANPQHFSLQIGGLFAGMDTV